MVGMGWVCERPRWVVMGVRAPQRGDGPRETWSRERGSRIDLETSSAQEKKNQQVLLKQAEWGETRADRDQGGRGEDRGEKRLKLHRLEGPKIPQMAKQSEMNESEGNFLVHVNLGSIGFYCG